MIDWTEYEQRKGELIKRNLSPDKYELEVQKLVKELQTMGKIIIESNKLESIAADLATIESQAEGVIAISHWSKNIENVIGMCYILKNFAKRLTDELYDLIENAQEMKESEVSNVSNGTSV